MHIEQRAGAPKRRRRQHQHQQLELHLHSFLAQLKAYCSRGTKEQRAESREQTPHRIPPTKAAWTRVHTHPCTSAPVKSRDAREEEETREGKWWKDSPVTQAAATTVVPHLMIAAWPIHSHASPIHQPTTGTHTHKVVGRRPKEENKNKKQEEVRTRKHTRHIHIHTARLQNHPSTAT